MSKPKTMFVLRIGGPVETAGRYLSWNDRYTGFIATDHAPGAIAFAGRSSAYTFRGKALKRVSGDGITLSVEKVEL